MSEMAKTGIFAGVALVVSLVAVFARPTLPVAGNTGLKVGSRLFPDFEDPAKGASLEVVEPTSSGEVKTFKVEKVEGRWVLASYKNYPADAVSRITSMASLLLGAEIISSEAPRLDNGKPVSEAEYHQDYGVVAPEAGKTKKDDKGVGTRITLRDAAGKPLASLIVGLKAVAEGAPGQPAAGQEELRFVRREGESTVYVAKFDLSKLSTNPADWMEKDLVKTRTIEGGQNSISDKVETATVRDYAISGSSVQPTQPAVNSEMTFRWQNFKPQIDEIKERRGPELVPFTMLSSEEPNSERIDQLKTTLDNLKFAEVEAKPAGGLDEALHATPALMQDREAVEKLAERGFFLRGGELFGNAGELVAHTKDGVEYILRFGGQQDLPPEPVKPDDKKDPKKPEVKKGRYLFLVARTNTTNIPKPDLLPLPVVEIGPAPGPEAPGKEGEPKEGKEPKAAEIAKKKAERDRIEKDNKRKQDEYDQKLKEADKAVRELNFRFADWYYLIPEEAYHELHPTRGDVLRERKDAKETGFEVDSFRDLEGGPKKKEAAPPPGPGGFGPGGFPGGFPPGFPGR
jgi:hypothetical protein